MKKIEDLKDGDFIAFGFNYNGGESDEIIVSNITSKHRDEFLVHFMYGHSSLGEYVKPENIVAIGNTEGHTKIKGWSGNFDLISSEHLLNKLLE